jgi:hypothetical protein
MPLKESLLQMSSIMPKRDGWAFGSLYEYFALKGDAMRSSFATRDERRAIWKRVAAHSPKIKQCFYNAQKMALMHPEEFIYFEGYVVTALGFPIHHGWCMTPTGLLVDPTLRIDHDKRFSMNNCVIGTPPTGWEYHGRWFENSRIETMWSKTGSAGSIVDDWENHWPLLKAV